MQHGLFDEAETFMRENLPHMRAVLGSEHEFTLKTAMSLAETILVNLGDRKDAGLARINARLGATGAAAKATSAVGEGVPAGVAEAEALLADAVGTMSRVFGPEHPLTRRNRATLNGLRAVLKPGK